MVERDEETNHDSSFGTSVHFCSPPLFLVIQQRRQTIMNGPTYSQELDGQRLETQMERVKALMIDGNWRTLNQIAEWVAGSEAGVSARLRDLRKEGLVVNRERVPGANGLWRYRVVQPIQQFRFESNGQGAFL